MIARSRNILFGAGAVLIALLLLAIPPVRAAASNLLSIFRVQNVVFLPIDPSRAQELESLDIDPRALFVGQQAGTPAEPMTAASAEEAARIAGFTPRAVTTLPDAATTTYAVTAASQRSGTVALAEARALLQSLAINDVELPDALGSAPITIASAPFVITTYTGGDYTLTLTQGAAPQVTLPPGVDPQLPNRALLRVMGFDAQRTAEIASQIDLSSTLIVPMPSDLRAARIVQIDGAQGLLTSGRGANGRGAQLVWQRDGTIYALTGTGTADDNLLLAAAAALR